MIFGLPLVQQATYPFQDSSLPAEQRLDNLLSLMTVDEKLSCFFGLIGDARFGIRGTGSVEGIHGLSMGGPRVSNRFPTTATTTFPQGIGLGATWDPDLIRQAAHAEGFEARYIYNTNPNSRFGSLVVMSPNADLGRDPRWGRTEECYGEDPFLNGTMVTAFVKGLQGDDPNYWLSASLLKHFLANSNEDDRTKSSSDFDERLWREYYSVPFRMGIMEGGARAFMAAYNSWNGIPCGANPMLRDVTMNEWGNDGLICTDGGALKQMVTDHKYFPDMQHAIAGTVKAGITRYLENARTDLTTTYKAGLITDQQVDSAVRRNFRLALKLGLLDPPEQVPYAKIGGAEKPWLTEAHKALARKVTQESIVLLKNSHNALPLDKAKLNSVAMIGPHANEVLLDWYSGKPPYAVSPLDGIQAKLGSNVKVEFAA
ncbi:MAG TPA: glycoside hydrolase family 3 N-terminal domain-containing protein, partial [Fimbriimonas sp.]|nr:glycoside hydrolase family 3 N-terminal domain-containing protein [Fimbriimonas sp.]